METSTDSLERIVLDASLRALAEQEAGLRDLRARAGTLLAASALTVSFLGTQALDRDGLDLVSWLAIAAFMTSLSATVQVLLPESGVNFAIGSEQLDARLWAVRDDLNRIHRELTRWATDRRIANQSVLDRLSASYRVAAMALLTQAGLWIAGLSPIV
jgi:hypothetical protein